MKDHGLSRLSESNPAGQAVKQDCAELLLHGLDSAAGGCEGEMQPPGCLGDVLGIGNFTQQAKVGGVQVDLLHGDYLIQNQS